MSTVSMCHWRGKQQQHHQSYFKIFQIPFDEGSLCRLFLYTAGGNYEAYDQPPLPTEVDKDVERMIHSLLEIDSSLRCTANQFYEEAISYDNSIC